MIGVVAVIVNDKKQILVSKRIDPDKKGYGCYALPGGKLETGESLYDCVKRETAEETGLDIITNDPFHVWQNGENLSIFIHCCPVSGEVVANPEPTKHSPWTWYTLETLATFIKPDKDWVPLAKLINFRKYLDL